MLLTQDNYYSHEANRKYMSVSQLKDFADCEAMAMAKLDGDYEQPASDALKLGSYVDMMLTGNSDEVDTFLKTNHDDIHQKNGRPYAEYAYADKTIELIRAQPLMMKYLSGQHQVIMTGQIEGIPFKIRMDSYQPGEFISDLKYMKSLRSPNLFQPMIDYWRYSWQAAIYQEIVYQNTGNRLPFIFVIATKEKPPHLAVAEIKQYNIDAALDEVRAVVLRAHMVKIGEEWADRCDGYSCDYCTVTRMLTDVDDTDMLGMSRAQRDAVKGSG